jgi:sortase (surface protein transpeptidase)
MTPGRARRVATAVAVAAAVALAGCGEPRGEFAGVSSTIGPQAKTKAKDQAKTGGQGQAGAASGVEAAQGFRSTRRFRPTPAPVRVEIPAIGVATRLQRLGRAGDGTIEVPHGPDKWDVAGWYEDGTRPGDPGSAVILGHVDSKSGPAVFYRLRELRRGDRVEVVRAGGSRVAFTVQRVEQYPKRRFPTAEVYYPTLEPMLRLVTCGGAFNTATGHYTDNVIVFASLGG